MSVDALFQAGHRARNDGNAAEAQRLYTAVLKAKPDHAGAHQLLGVLMLEGGDARAANDYFDRAMSLAPNEPSIHQNMAMALAALGDTTGAVAAIERAIALKPDYAMAFLNRGNMLMSVARFDDAIESFQQAVSLGIRDTMPYYAMGHAYTAIGLREQALACYAHAIQLKPDFLEAVCNRGSLLLEMERFDEALSGFNRALVLNPKLAETHFNRGMALFKLGRRDEAVQSFDRAVALKPDYALALAYKGLALHDAGRYGESVDAFDAAVVLAADFLFLKGTQLFGALNVCRWQNFEAEVSALLKDVEREQALVEPFQLLCFPSTPAQQKICAERYVAQKFSSQVPIHSNAPRKPGEPPVDALSRVRRLRIAYVCKDLREHATAALFTEALEQHDRGAFEVFAFSHGPDDKSPARARLITAFEHFIDVRGQSDAEIAQRIAALDIDIAVDLDGHTTGARPAILSFRPARVQAQFLAYPGTMGAGHIDYIIADAVVAPAEHAPYYREKLIHLPGSYQPNSARPAVEISTRGAHGLPADKFVFGCLNNNFKITPDAFESWMRILARVPDSVLWLFSTNDTASTNMRAEAARRGIDPARLFFASRTDRASHLARVPLMDLFLDTFIYGAHTTGSDALWSGVPLVTKLGGAFPSRVGASLLTAVGLPELITHTVADYENLAVALAGDAPRLARLREHLCTADETAALFDAKSFARHLESAFRTMAKRHESGQKPESFTVAP